MFKRAIANLGDSRAVAITRCDKKIDKPIVVSAEQTLHAEDSSAQKREKAHGVSGPGADELATALAMMHATLESTTDAILLTDETNYVREFNEKYVRFWGVPPHMMISAHASELWNYISPQLKVCGEVGVFHRITCRDASTLIPPASQYPQLYSETGNDGSKTQDAFCR